MHAARQLRHADLDALGPGVCRGCRKPSGYFNQLWCNDCRRIKELLSGRVSAAVKRGELHKLDGSIKCHCCDLPAKAYDHRDYDKPYEVIPLCRSCNGQAGPGRLSMETIHKHKKPNRRTK